MQRLKTLYTLFAGGLNAVPYAPVGIGFADVTDSRVRDVQGIGDSLLVVALEIYTGGLPVDWYSGVVLRLMDHAGSPWPGVQPRQIDTAKILRSRGQETWTWNHVLRSGADGSLWLAFVRSTRWTSFTRPARTRDERGPNYSSSLITPAIRDVFVGRLLAGEEATVPIPRGSDTPDCQFTEIRIEAPTAGVEDDDQIEDNETPIHETTLSPIYPNPSSTIATFPVTIHEEGWVELWVFDVTGRRVLSPVGDVLPVGRFEFRESVSDLAEGTYFARLRSGSISVVRRFVVVR